MFASTCLWAYPGIASFLRGTAGSSLSSQTAAESRGHGPVAPGSDDAVRGTVGGSAASGLGR